MSPKHQVAPIIKSHLSSFQIPINYKRLICNIFPSDPWKLWETWIIFKQMHEYYIILWYCWFWGNVHKWFCIDSQWIGNLMIFLLDSIHVYIATQSLIGILCGNAIVILLIHRRDENRYWWYYWWENNSWRKKAMNLYIFCAYPKPIQASRKRAETSQYILFRSQLSRIRTC